MSWTDRILGSPTRLTLLRALASHADHALGVRELGRLAGVSPIQTSRLVRDFARLGLVRYQTGSTATRGRPAVAIDLSHPVMREVVLPLLAFEERELERSAAVIANRLAERGFACRAVASTIDASGTHRLIAVVAEGVDPRRATATLRARGHGHVTGSVLEPSVEVRTVAGVRGLAVNTLRRRWGDAVSQLTKEEPMAVLSPLELRHDFARGLDGWVLHDPLAQRARWLGRDSLMLGGGGAVLAPVAPAPPYTLRATVSGGPGECYVGFCFHVADADNFETVYLAPQGGSDPAAVQYDPVINGSHTWQIFGDADGVGDPLALADAPLRREHWHRLRLDVWPEMARVYVDDNMGETGEMDAARCLGTFPLRSGRVDGRVGLWGYLPSYVADFEVCPLEEDAPASLQARVVPPSGVVREWLIARYDADARRFTDVQPATAEHNGMLCLNRAYRFVPGALAYAGCEIELPPAEEAALEIGYSDRARVWWDGALIHEGEWRWDTVAGTDGRVRAGHRTVPLPAEPGWHRLQVEVAVVEPPFGWGLAARVTADGAPCPTRPVTRLETPLLR